MTGILATRCLQIVFPRGLPQRFLNFEGVITLVVGPNRKELTIHKNLLCSVSPFSNAALNRGFSESGASSFEMLEDELEVVEAFLSMIYVQAALGTKCEQNRLPDLNSVIADLTWTEKIENSLVFPIKLYCLAERLGALSLRDAILKKLVQVDYHNKRLVDLDPLVLNPEAYILAWNNLPEGCPVRRFLVDIIAAVGLHKIGYDLEEYPHKALASIVLAIKAKEDGAALRGARIGRHMYVLELQEPSYCIGMERYLNEVDIDDENVQGMFKRGDCGPPGCPTLRRIANNDDVWQYSSADPATLSREDKELPLMGKQSN